MNSSPVMQDPSIVPSTPSSKPEMAQSTKKSIKKLSRGVFIIIVVGDFALFLLIARVLLCY